MSARARAAAEFVATAFLLAAIIGSGVMAERLAGGNAGLALLANALATGGVLMALILAFGPVSGAHMNPVVTLVGAASGALPWPLVPAYIVAQCAGALAGTLAAHAMFELPLLQWGAHVRTGTAQWIAEALATFGLVSIVCGCSRRNDGQAVAVAVAGYIVGAYWFTASTSFANPAVTLGRAFTDTFAGIRPADLPGFVAAQAIGAALAAALWCWFNNATRRLQAHDAVDHDRRIRVGDRP